MKQSKKDLIAERVLFAWHIYSGYSVSSRGPSGCLMDILKEVRPDLAKKISAGDDVSELYDKEFGDE